MKGRNKEGGKGMEREKRKKRWETCPKVNEDC